MHEVHTSRQEDEPVHLPSTSSSNNAIVVHSSLPKDWQARLCKWLAGPEGQLLLEKLGFKTIDKQNTFSEADIRSLYQAVLTRRTTLVKPVYLLVDSRETAGKQEVAHRQYLPDSKGAYTLFLPRKAHRHMVDNLGYIHTILNIFGVSPSSCRLGAGFDPAYTNGQEELRVYICAHALQALHLDELFKALSFAFPPYAGALYLDGTRWRAVPPPCDGAEDNGYDSRTGAALSRGDDQNPEGYQHELSTTTSVGNEDTESESSPLVLVVENGGKATQGGEVTFSFETRTFNHPVESFHHPAKMWHTFGVGGTYSVQILSPKTARITLTELNTHLTTPPECLSLPGYEQIFLRVHILSGSNCAHAKLYTPKTTEAGSGAVQHTLYQSSQVSKAMAGAGEATFAVTGPTLKLGGTSTKTAASTVSSQSQDSLRTSTVVCSQTSGNVWWNFATTDPYRRQHGMFISGDQLPAATFDFRPAEVPSTFQINIETQWELPSSHLQERNEHRVWYFTARQQALLTTPYCLSSETRRGDMWYRWGPTPQGTNCEKQIRDGDESVKLEPMFEVDHEIPGYIPLDSKDRNSKIT